LKRIRRFALVASGAIVLLALWSFWWEPASLVVRDEALSLAWPGTTGPRIAVLADLHVGSPFNDLARLKELVRRTNATSPDVICILGDLVTQGVRGGTFVPPEDIGAILADLRAPAGVFAVLGNHDGWFNHDRVARALVKHHVRVVEDTAVRIETGGSGWWLAGVSDLWTGRHDIAGALDAAKDDGSPVILMTHNPDLFPDVPARVALTLAGHTHGGQVWLPLIGRPIVPSQFGQRFAAGHIVEGGRHLYVATGVGTSIFPVRLGVPPAIPVIRIVPR
jgi:predicted MPP superfamily phosphohydrolase